MLTVMTWFWQQPGGRTSYTAEHVNIWAAMVRRNLALPHRIACVTDIPDGIDPRVEIIEPPRDFEAVRIPTWGDKLPQCLRRLAMFRPDAAAVFGDRFVNMDLDVVIGGSLDPLFDRPDDFMMYRGTSKQRPYNGSMLMMTAGARPQVYTDFTPERAAEAGRKFIGSDQAWISHRLGPGEKTWGIEDGVFWRKERSRTEFSEETARVLFFPGDIKPWGCFDDPWIDRHYRGDCGGRCLILGYAPTVWEEAESALKSGPFDAVIASAEAAAHWSGDILAVARSDDEAEEIAKRRGFAEVVFCGRQPALEAA